MLLLWAINEYDLIVPDAGFIRAKEVKRPAREFSGYKQYYGQWIMGSFADKLYDVKQSLLVFLLNLKALLPALAAAYFFQEGT